MIDSTPQNETAASLDAFRRNATIPERAETPSRIFEVSIPIERGTCSTAVCRRAERAGSNAFTRRPLAQFSRRIGPRRVVGLFVAPFQLFAHHQLRPPSTPPFVEPPCSAFRRSRSAQRSSICGRRGVSSHVNTGTAHQTKEARRVESASFLRGYARGALGAI